MMLLEALSTTLRRWRATSPRPGRIVRGCVDVQGRRRRRSHCRAVAAAKHGSRGLWRDRGGDGPLGARPLRLDAIARRYEALYELASERWKSKEGKTGERQRSLKLLGCRPFRLHFPARSGAVRLVRRCNPPWLPIALHIR